MNYFERFIGFSQQTLITQRLHNLRFKVFWATENLTQAVVLILFRVSHHTASKIGSNMERHRVVNP